MFNFRTDYSDNTALIDDLGKVLTYSQLDNISGQLSSHMAEEGLVILVASNSLGAISGYVSFISSHHPTLIIDKWDQDSFESLIIKYLPTYFWIPEEYELLPCDYSLITEMLGYKLLKCNTPRSLPISSDLALLLPTSGSTGSPKFVRISYENIISNTNSIVNYLGINSQDRTITTLPMSYTYGLSIINTHLSVGASILLTDKSVLSKGFWPLFNENKITNLNGVPYTYQILLKLGLEKMHLSSLRFMTQAGGKLSEELQFKLSKYNKANNCEFYVMYGQTEATARMSYLPSCFSLTKLGSIGIAIPGGEFKIKSKAGEFLDGYDEVGELVYSGNNVSLGYSNSYSDLSAEDDFQGTLYTGDLAKKDKDGFYYIVGRVKRFVKINGHRVNLDDIERLLVSNFNYSDIACSGIDDEISVYTSNTIDSMEIKKFLSEKMSVNIRYIHVCFVTSIPRSSSGKVQYSKLDLERKPLS